MDDQAPCARPPSGAGRDPDDVTICVAAPAYVGDDLAHMRDQCRWFGGMVGNHVADIVGRYGDSSDVPAALTEYIKGRQGYDYNEHGQAGNVHADFVPDEIVDRFCILGPVDEHAAPAATSCATSASTSSPSTSSTTARTHTLQAYGEHVIPALAEHGVGQDVTVPTVAQARCCSSLALGAASPAAWELYKAGRARTTAARSLGWRILPRANDTRDAARVGDGRAAVRRPRAARRTAPIWRVVLAGGWYSFRLALVGFVLGSVVGIALADGDGPLRRRRAAACCRTSSCRRPCR